MSLDKVIEKVRSTGLTEAQAIRDAAASEKERILAEARDEAEGRKSDRLVEAKEAGARLRNQELAKADLQSKKVSLVAQKDILDRVLETARGRIAASPRRSEVIRALLRQNREEAASGRIFSHPDDEAAVVASGYSPEGTIQCLGGLTIESADGSRRVDLRFESILDSVWRDSVKEIAGILWEEAPD